MINYIDDTLYDSNDDEMRKNFEKRLSENFHLSLIGEVKWYLGMRITQKETYISLDQDQYVKNITARFEKVFKNLFKGKQSQLPTKFTPIKKDRPTTEKQTKETKETKLIFGNINYR